MQLPDDDVGLHAVLAHVGADADAVLGRGGEAWIVAIDERRVVRVGHHAFDARSIDAQIALVDELRATATVALPEVLEVGEVDGRHFTIERRLPGRSVDVELSRLDRADRTRLVHATLDAVAGLGEIDLEPVGWFGDVITPEPIRSSTWRGFLTAKIENSLTRAPGFEAVEPAALVRAFPSSDDVTPARFVHLDAFFGNALADGCRVTAIIDIGHTSAVGDPRLDQVAAAVYACSEEITPSADEADRTAAREWLRDRRLDAWEEPVRRWLAAYWAWADDDVRLHRWCRRVLLG